MNQDVIIKIEDYQKLIKESQELDILINKYKELILKDENSN